MFQPRHVFISYKREDAAQAAAVRNAWRALRFNVWWDEELQTGERWEERNDEVLISADAVVVAD